ncbi:MAG: glycosyltransferase family 2 protein [Lachnospiraceae bacterium]|nr:glycosyltransferase family 2 protein [Lachnospiraceae bacterium]
MSKVAIVILVYRDSESAINLVNSIKNKSVVDEIILVDNCSPDDSFLRLKKIEDSHVHVIQTTANDGIAKGNNYGAAYAKELCPDVDYYLFSNPDVIVDVESIRNMVSFLENNSDVGAVCPMELTKEKEFARDFAWRMPTYWTMVKSVLPIYTKLNSYKKEFLWFYDVEEATKQEVFYADVLISCFIMVRRTAYELVGGFYEKTFLYNEENFLAFRLNENGIKRAVLMKYPIVHLGCTSMQKTNNKWEWKARILFDSSYIFLRDCLKKSKIALCFFSMCFYFGVFERKLFRLLSGKEMN